MALLAYDPEALRRQLVETLGDLDARPEEVERTVDAIVGTLERFAGAGQAA